MEVLQKVDPAFRGSGWSFFPRMNPGGSAQLDSLESQAICRSEMLYSVRKKLPRNFPIKQGLLTLYHPKST